MKSDLGVKAIAQKFESSKADTLREQLQKIQGDTTL